MPGQRVTISQFQHALFCPIYCAGSLTHLLRAIKNLFSLIFGDYTLTHISYAILWKVFFSFASAAVKIRTSGIRKFLRLSSYKVIDGDMSQYHFGMVLKETMLNLGPAFIKGKKKCCLLEILVSM